MSTPSRRELTQAGFSDINANHGVDDEIMQDIGYDTVQALPDTIERVKALGSEATAPIFHVNQIGHRETPEKPAKPVKDDQFTARERAWGDTTPADNGLWSDLG